VTYIGNDPVAPAFRTMPLFGRRTHAYSWDYFVQDGTRNKNQYELDRKTKDILNTGDEITISGLPGVYRVTLDEVRDSYDL